MRGKSDKSNFVIFALSALAFIALSFLTGNIPRAQFAFFILAYGAWFTIYFVLCTQGSSTKQFYGIQNKIVEGLAPYQWIAIVARVVLLFAPPLLSDDVYRFIWDGNISIAGLNPFDHTPQWFMDNPHPVENLTPLLFDHLNSKPFHTVYPPVCQAIFALAAFVGNGNIMLSIFIIKFILLIAEVVTIIMLPRVLQLYSLPASAAMWYTLNPLVIIETVGNCHFEGLMLCLFLAALYFQHKDKMAISCMFFSASILTKLLTLLLLPLMSFLMPRYRFIRYAFICGLVSILAFVPFCNITFIHNIGSGIGLYFNYLEFNASVYTFMKWGGWTFLHCDITPHYGFVLPLIAALCILIFYWRTKQSILFAAMLGIFCVYILLSRAVHPWYLIPVILFGTLTSYRFTVLWSAIVMFTYITYSYAPYRENYLLVTCEYITVGLYAAYEYNRRMNMATELF